MNLNDLQPNIYPVRLLENCDSGLCLFGAGFYGANDAIHLYYADMPYVQIVDIDANKLSEMEAAYPKEWVFTTADVKEWVPIVANASLLSWDIVSVDAPTQLFRWVLDNLDTIAKLANKYLVITMYADLEEEVRTDDSEWKQIAKMTRSNSGLIELLVYERVN